MTNIERAQRGASAVWLMKDDVDDQTALSDLLANLMHFAKDAGLDFEQAMGSGRMHYEAEISEAPNNAPYPYPD